MNCSHHSTFRLANFAASKLCRKKMILTLSWVDKQCFSVAPNSVPKKDESTEKDLLVAKQTYFLRNKLGENNVTDWKSLVEETINLRGPLNKRNISGRILDICTGLQNLDAGKSYFNYLKSSNTPLSLAVTLMYFKLCYRCKNQLTKNDREELSKMYETLVLKHKMLLAGMVAESVILGVSLTDKWKEGRKYLEIAKETGTPNVISYISLVEAAASHSEFDTALELLEENYGFDRYGTQHALSSFINGCVQHNQTSYIEALFHLISRHTVIPDADFAETLVDICAKKQIPFEGTKTSITNNGRCENCSQFLAPIKITKEQYDELRSALVSSSLIGTNIFIKTNPSELKSFLNFIEKTAPYDVVIDGLNTAFLQNGSKYSKSFTLKKVVEQFVKKDQKILILGRKHMKGYRDSNMQYVFNHCEFFFVDNVSSDDHFLLYAALYSDLGTNFVSNDFMRGHKALLATTELKRTFKLWQQSHQICPMFVSESYVNLKYPMTYQLMPHVLKDGTWHIPYSTCNETNFMHSYSYHGENLSWLCVTPIKNKSTEP